MRKSALVSQSSDLPESLPGHNKKKGTHYQVALVQILRNYIFPSVNEGYFKQENVLMS